MSKVKKFPTKTRMYEARIFNPYDIGRLTEWKVASPDTACDTCYGRTHEGERPAPNAEIR